MLLLDTLALLPAIRSARVLHTIALLYLRHFGFRCERDYVVPNRGDGRKGRVDIRASYGSEIAYIELDRKTPRAKSIFKVQQPDATVSIVYCRE